MYFRPGPNGGIWLTVAAAQRMAKIYAVARIKQTSDNNEPLRKILEDYLPLLTSAKPSTVQLVSTSRLEGIEEPIEVT